MMIWTGKLENMGEAGFGICVTMQAVGALDIQYMT